MNLGVHKNLLTVNLKKKTSKCVAIARAGNSLIRSSLIPSFLMSNGCSGRSGCSPKMSDMSESLMLLRGNE